MSSSGDVYASRRWMYERFDPTTKKVSSIFYKELEKFIEFAKSQPLFAEKNTLFCPCTKCENKAKLLPESVVSAHLINRGFMLNYWIWTSHGEDYNVLSNDITEDVFTSETHGEQTNPYVTMVSNAFDNRESEFDHMMEEDPNPEAKKFYDVLDAAKQPIYDGCKEGLSKLSLAGRLMSLKTDYNLSQNCMDSIAKMMQEYLPGGNNSPKSYYDIKKLMRCLGLPYQKIDVCQDNCMIYWKATEKEECCLFCKKDRFRPSKKIGQKKIAYRQMFYLPIADRLKRLYQSCNTAKHMRWHAEHLANDGEMCHPSDGEA